jgi:hypothetical protein
MGRPLSGIQVIGLEQYMSAPYCTMLLADAGAVLPIASNFIYFRLPPALSEPNGSPVADRS